MTPERQRAILAALELAEAETLAGLDDAAVAEMYKQAFDARGALISEGDEPVTPEQAKRQARIDGAAEDEMLDGYIVAARETVEKETGLILKRRTITQTFPGFDTRMRLRSWPVVPETLMLTYVGTDGAAIELPTARMLAYGRPAAIAPAAGGYWPSAHGQVRATFVAGFADAQSVPRALWKAMLLLVQAEYDPVADRGLLEAAAHRICRRYKRWTA